MNDPAPVPAVTLVGLHFLGGTGREWDEVSSHLPPHLNLLAVDLPGFGAHAARPERSVADMARFVRSRVEAEVPGRFVLLGHSMGAKVAAVLARWAEDGDPALSALSGLVTLGGSPPRPEPMDEDQRAAMLSWFRADAHATRRQAGDYIRANLGAPVPPPVHQALVDGVLAASLDAWTAWLEGGSREDWSARIGRLRLPALLLGGTADPALGHPAQEEHLLPHFADAEAVSLRGAGHLLPSERPALIARLVASRFAAPLSVPPDYAALIGSDRVSTGTRAALTGRAEPPPVPDTLSAVERGILRAVVDRLVPQSGPARIDIASRLANQLAGPGDGWRPALLPPDLPAWQAGLRTLDAIAHGFAGLDEPAQDAVMDRVAAGRGGGHAEGLLDARQMQAWFEELGAEATRCYVSHPATFARLGYGGIAYGGDGPGKPGFHHIGINQREAWEPA